MKEIDWSKAPGDAIGAFSQGESQTFFVKTKEPSDYMNRPGYKGLRCDGNVYHVFTEFWAWSERPWAGEGLPPVGVECEVKNDINDGWDRVDEVLAHTTIKGAVVAVFKRDDRVFYSPADAFRPLRTPEQIAAEERQRAIEQMASDALGRCDIHGATYLYNAGYRKVTP